MRNVIYRVGRIGVAVGAAILLAGCGLSSVDGPPGGPATGPAVTITQHVAPSALLAVMDGPASGPALSGLLASTARPNEDVRILQAGTPATTIVASDSPAPAQIVIPGPPAAPGGGQTAYQTAQYAKKLKAWRAKRAAEVQAEAAETAREGVGLAGRPGDPAEDQQAGRSARGRRAAWPPRARSPPARWRAWRRRPATSSAAAA